MAIKTLAELQSDIEAHEAAATPGSSSETIYGLLVEFCQTLSAGKYEEPGAQAQIAELKKKIDALQSLLDNDAKTFQAIKLALGNANLTQGQLVNEIQTNWRRI